MKFLFVFSAVYFSYMLGCVANPVNTMRELLSYSGWRVLADPFDGIDIIDRRQGTGQPDRQLPWNVFTAIQVNEENVAEIIRLTYQFLSCYYAGVLIDLSDYEKGIGAQCRRLDMTATFGCLEDYLWTINYKNPVVSRMIGALSSLYDLSSTNTQLQTDVFDVLMVMRDYYKQKTIVRPTGCGDPAIKKFADHECSALEDHAHLMSNRLFAFSNRFCWPITSCVRDRICSKATYIVKTIVEEARDPRKMSNVIIEIKKRHGRFTNRFIETHDNTFGFEYDSELDTTRIITYDPETAVRVVKLNQLLANNKWTKLGVFTKERGRYNVLGGKALRKKNDGTAIVTRENVYTKLKLAHLLLSCKYAFFLKKCCGQTASMWSNCHESQDSVCLDEFLQILNDDDPSVMRMVDALSYIQNISPNTAYKKGVYDSLIRFKRFYNKLPRNKQSWSAAIEKDIAEITQTTDEFFSQFCCM